MQNFKINLRIFFLTGISPSLNRFRVNKLTDVLDWEFINRTLFSYRDANPKRRVPSTMTEGFNDILREVSTKKYN